MEFSEDRKRIRRNMGRAMLYEFARWMFVNRRNYPWQRAPHHKLICDKLEAVMRGDEVKRLIINVPPRYSKTELVKLFVAYALGHYPDSEFIYTSYSGRLAAASSFDVRNMLGEPEYRAMFPQTVLREDSAARDEWRTTAGGMMYAVGSGGTITGYGAGKHRPGFGGCFPYGQMVETEIGQIAIGEIVTRRIPVRVWSWNEQSGAAELMPIDTFWTNPENDIVEVGMPDGSSFRCTPNHELLTGAGWVEASHLSNALDLVQRQTGFLHGLLACFRWVDCRCDDIRRVFRPVSPVGIWKVRRNARPCLAKLDLPNHSSADTILSGDACRSFGAGEDRNNLFPREFRARPPLKQRKGSVPDGVLHVLGLGSPCKIFERISSAVAVKVSSLVRVWSTAYECLKHKVSDVSRRYFAVHREVDAEISLAVVTGLKKAHGDFPANATHVGDFVNPLGASYIKPSFVRDVGHVDVTFCLEVRSNNNFILAQSGVIVSNCIIVDDPHKADEARSDVMRGNVIDWYKDTLQSRTNSPDTPIIYIGQRLHESDLAGWLLAGGSGEAWDSLILPAIQEDGTALWPEKHSIEELRRMEQSMPYTFAGQYQQRPAPAEGGLFKPDRIEVIDAVPVLPIHWVRAWDLASVSDGGDWTAGAKLGRMPDGRFIIADMVRVQEGPDQRDATMLNTAKRDGLGVRIDIPQDPGQAGKTQVAYLTREFIGHRVVSSPESGDKVTRAEPLAAQINVGNVLMARASWNDALINEMRMFPNGKNDDQVDALSRAFAGLIGNYRMQISPDTLQKAAR